MPSPGPLGSQRGHRRQATDRRAATSRRILGFAGNAFVTERLRIAGGVSRLPQPVRRTGLFSERTPWIGRLTPLGRFLRTETAGAALLIAAVLAALVWANIGSSYLDVWEPPVALTFGEAGIDLSLREWVNSGLMTIFFLVVGLEARRELDLGELRERRRFALPFLAGLGGIAAAVALYLAFNGGHSSAHGWGIVMSTDTAFALGLLALVGPRFPDRLRAFMLTVVVVDDIFSVVIIATVYT